MSPRPAPTNQDATAQQFLALAAELIDASLSPRDRPRPRRLQALHLPATLEWLRTEDVIRLAEASGRPGLSRKAFTNRWPIKDAFVNDAIVYALLFRDKAQDPVLEPSQLERLTGTTSLSHGIIDIADAHLDRLFHDPRSYLLVHIGPLLDHHPEIRSEVLPTIRGTRTWFDGYVRVLTDLGLQLRPGWTAERLGLSLQALLDGFLFRYRIQPEDYGHTRWEGASLFADTVIAFCLGAIDVGRSNQSARAALDAAVASGRRPAE